MSKLKKYLSSVKLSGYKSIHSVDIDLGPKLNIIIGKNAAGKTNFLSFLNKVINLSFDELVDFSSKLTYSGTDVFTIEAERDLQDDVVKRDFVFSKKNIIQKLFVNEIELPDNTNNGGVFTKKLNETKLRPMSTFICHGVPKNYDVVDKPFSFTIEKNGHSGDLLNIITDIETPYFVKTILLQLILVNFNIRRSESIEIENVRSALEGIFSLTDSVKSELSKFSSIEDVRFSTNYNIYISEDRDKAVINNIFLEFQVDGNWLPFSSLSDGTKRIFYILSEVSSPTNLFVNSSDVGIYYEPDEEINRIILIEEPELGIHPHQFHKLMLFLKEYSDSRQIVITTHAPQSLDVLTEDELGSIIIAFNMNDRGTQLRHLNEKEQTKAKVYIENEFLSDYWRFSDLEL